jgi:hypothetical protein
MGTAWLSMSYRLVLAYQSVVQIVLVLDPPGLRCVDLVVANTHRAQEGPLVVWL